MSRSKQKTEISNKSKALSTYARQSSYAQKLEKLFQELKKAKEKLDNTPSDTSKAVEKIIKNDIELMYIKHKIREVTLSLTDISESSKRVATIRADNQRLRDALTKTSQKPR